MTKAGHSLAWKICLLLAFCHWIDARRPDMVEAAVAATEKWRAEDAEARRATDAETAG